MVYTALIPVKALSEAKSRLAAHLSLEQRGALMLEMLHHVLGTLHDSGVFARVSVVSPDAHVRDCARQWGAHTYVEEVAGHNPALTAAATRELERGSTALLTISADLPLLSTQDIAGMVEQSRHCQVVLAPSRDGTGTNALLVRPPLALPYLFGPNSLPHYQAEARRRWLSSTLYTSNGLGLDVDTIEDLFQAQTGIRVCRSKRCPSSRVPRAAATSVYQTNPKQSMDCP